MTGREIRMRQWSQLDYCGETALEKAKVAGHIPYGTKRTFVRRVLVCTGGLDAGCKEGATMDAPALDLGGPAGGDGSRQRWLARVYMFPADPSKARNKKSKKKDSGPSDTWMLASGHYFENGEVDLTLSV
jgi:hypothetical protein